ncbi:hypothetical protein HAX54_026661 [Datura stramonium]|uniref:Uncharacterized protein n=1 Tax=Datura stramonium TaxID=4076 RepID=A0ABS8S817_DATST|nr:hypothetical protein [Datura stramonium]
MRGETGLGRDAKKNTIMADGDWWERKNMEDVKYKKFRNKDLSLIWNHYNALFYDIVATRERAWAVNQEQISGIRADPNEEGINDIDGYVKEHFTNPNDKASDETLMKEEIHSLIELMSSKSTATSPSVDDPIIDKCMDILSNLHDIPEGSGIYNYTVNMFLKKDVRQVFLKMTTNEAQKS